MTSFGSKFPAKQVAVIDIEHFIIEMEWAEFLLRRRIINCLLTLFTLAIMFSFVMLALGRVRLSLTGAIMAGTVGYIGRLLRNSLKSIFPAN